MTTSNEHGRVDEQGNVFLKTPEGEVKVGQYAAGEPQEGLAFFTKRYEDIVAEIGLALDRLKEGKANPESVKALIERIESTLTSPNMLGNLDTLREHKSAIEEQFAVRKEEIAAKKAELKAAALTRREEIVTLAESLVDSTQWKATGEKFKSLLDEWKTLPNADRAKEQELWKRFSHARSAFDKARRTYFHNLDEARADAQSAKKAIIAKAHALADSTEWGATTGAFKNLMNDWKNLPRAAKSAEDKLWSEFKVAQDKFFDARNAALSVRDEELSGNLTVKLSLLEKAEALLPIKDVESAKSAMREIQEQWEKAGHVPRNDKEKVERRLKAVEDAIRKVTDEQWNRSKPEVVQRANGMVAQFEASVAKLDAQIEAAQAAGKTDDVVRLQASRAQSQALLDAARAGAANLG